MNGSAWEWLRMYEDDSYSGMGCVILCWCTWYEMHEDVWECIRLSHTAWACMWCECMRMTEDVWGWLIFRKVNGWFSAELHYTTCMIMNGNAWEWLRMSEDDSYWGMGCVILGCYAWYDMHENVRECIMLSRNEWACMWWVCMRMSENVWGWLMFKKVGGSF